MAETYDPPDKRHPPETRIPAPATTKRADIPHLKSVATLVDLVSTDRLRADVAALAAFHTRHTFSIHIPAAADHLVERFHTAGHKGASKRLWTRSGHTGQNIVAIKPGVAPTPRTVILGAHYDSRMGTASDAASRAPGADDNASGVAAVLEIARLLADVELVDTVHLLCFSGEEQGLWGSTEYAAQLEAEGVAAHKMINLDMIGHPPADGSITVERDTGNAVPGNDAASLALGAVMSQAATDYTTLPVMLGPIYSSDYMPFEARGWVTVGAYEGEGNPHYHQTSDDVGTLDYGYLTQVTRMVLATLLQALPGGPVATGDDMQPGEVLLPGQSISSANGRYTFVYQADGNLVLYGPGGAPLWASNTNGQPVGVTIMQGDGNLVVYNAAATAVWASGTDGNPGSRLVLQDDGNLVIYTPQGQPIWASNTAQAVMPSGPAASGDDMQPGEVLTINASIRSADGRFRLIYQDDTNLVLYRDTDGVAQWDTRPQPGGVGVCIMQGDGNLVVYNAAATAVWASGTDGNPGSRLVLQDDGNLVIYTPQGQPIWASNTAQAVMPSGPAASGDDMQPGEVLTINASIRSADGRFRLIYQDDTNLVLYRDTDGVAQWDTRPQPGGVGVCIMQGDGNLVVYNAAATAVWASGTDGNPGSRLVLQDDGNLVIYTPQGQPIWASNTAQAVMPGGPAASGDDMQPGEVLTINASIRSADGRFRLIYQDDTNLVLYRDTDGVAQWDTRPQPGGVGVCIMQGDGNLVVYNAAATAVWASGTDGNPGSRLVLQDDGNLVIYTPQGQPIWASNTVQP